jgi:hypothetical protein
MFASGKVHFSTWLDQLSSLHARVIHEKRGVWRGVVPACVVRCTRRLTFTTFLNILVLNWNEQKSEDGVFRH